MSEEIHFRSLMREDLEAVSELERLVLPVPWTRPMLEAEFKKAVHKAQVAIIDGVLRGYILANCVATELHIITLGVHPLYRRRGIARALLKSVMGQAFDVGVRLVTLEVRESNEAAKSLYLSLGFSEKYKRKRYYSDTLEDALVLECEM